jgi:hypothetical protein
MILKAWISCFRFDAMQGCGTQGVIRQISARLVLLGETTRLQIVVLQVLKYLYRCQQKKKTKENRSAIFGL